MNNNKLIDQTKESNTNKNINNEFANESNFIYNDIAFAGLKTRKLVKLGEEILAEQNKNK